MDLTVGPNFFFWPAETVRGFYRDLAGTSVARVVLGELVCSKRLPFWQDEIPGAVEALLAGESGVMVGVENQAMVVRPLSDSWERKSLFDPDLLRVVRVLGV